MYHKMANYQHSPQSNYTRTHNPVITKTTVPRGKNEYAHIWETPLPDPAGAVLTGDSDYGSQSNYSGAPRQAGAKISSPGDMSSGQGTEASGYTGAPSIQSYVSDGPRYFVLDKDVMHRDAV